MSDRGKVEDIEQQKTPLKNCQNLLLHIIVVFASVSLVCNFLWIFAMLQCSNDMKDNETVDGFLHFSDQLLAPIALSTKLSDSFTHGNPW